MTHAEITLLESIVGHLHAAKSQRSPNDDQIIADHVEDAYEAASKLLRVANALGLEVAA